MNTISLQQDIFSKQASAYAQYRPTYPTELYDFILGRLKNKNNAWDCGTGTGQVACVLANHFKNVIATDISEGQLYNVIQKPNIQYKLAPAEDSSLPDNHFDLITVAQAIHWFDFEKFYKEVKRTATPDALLAVIGYGNIHIREEINRIFEDMYNNMFGIYFSDNRQYVYDNYTTIPFPFEEIETPEFTTNLNWQLQDFIGFVSSWSPVQKFKDEYGHNPMKNFIKKLSPYWKNDEIKEVSFPVFMRLGKIIVTK